jgi:hypothetical protein
MEIPTCSACCEKKMLGWIREKMVTPESTRKGGRFSTSGLITTKNDASTRNNLCTIGKDCSIATGNNS